MDYKKHIPAPTHPSGDIPGWWYVALVITIIASFLGLLGFLFILFPCACECAK